MRCENRYISEELTTEDGMGLREAFSWLEYRKGFTNVRMRAGCTVRRTGLVHG